MMSRVELTTTSYAMLGLLSLRPWTTYELAQQVQRSLRDLWPVAERQLYEQPKTLVAHGLAAARKGTTGARPRTTYRITPKGRRALAEWLAEPEGAVVLRSELLLKAFFAEQAAEPKAALTAAVESLAALLREGVAAEADRFAANREAGYRFPERRHVSALVASYYGAIARATEAWAAWALERTADWPADLSVPEDVEAFMAEVYGR